MAFGTKEEIIEAREKTRKAIDEFIKNDKYYGSVLARIPKNFQNTFYKVYSKNRSRTTAMNAKCLDCTCFDRKEITECEIKHCPLWNFRPYQK